MSEQSELLNSRIAELQTAVDENGGQIPAGQAQKKLDIGIGVFERVDQCMRQREPEKYARSKGIIKEIGQYAETMKKLRNPSTYNTPQKEPEAGIFLPIFDRKLMTFIFDP